MNERALTMNRFGLTTSLLFIGLLMLVSFQVAFGQATKPRPEPLTLEQKSKLPYAFIAEFESLGAKSALSFAPNLNLGHLGGGSSNVVIRIVKPLRFPADKLLPQRLLVSMYPNWFYNWEHRQNISLAVMENLFREHYLGKQFIFFGSSMFPLDGVADPQVLQSFANRDYMIHEPLDRLPEVQRLAGQMQQSANR